MRLSARGWFIPRLGEHGVVLDRYEPTDGFELLEVERPPAQLGEKSPRGVFSFIGAVLAPAWGATLAFSTPAWGTRAPVRLGHA